MTHTLTDKRRNALKSVRRRWRTVATWLENNDAGLALLARESPAHRVLVEEVPALVRENRAIADLADSILTAGEFSVEQWNAFAWRVKRSAAHIEAICEEAIRQSPKPADGAVP
jgi:hypothetical protein